MVAYLIYNAVTGNKENIEALRRETDEKVWKTSLVNEWGRLAQGVGEQTNSEQCIKGRINAKYKALQCGVQLCEVGDSGRSNSGILDTYRL